MTQEQMTPEESTERMQKVLTDILPHVRELLNYAMQGPENAVDTAGVLQAMVREIMSGYSERCCEEHKFNPVDFLQQVVFASSIVQFRSAPSEEAEAAVIVDDKHTFTQKGGDA